MDKLSFAVLYAWVANKSEHGLDRYDLEHLEKLTSTPQGYTPAQREQVRSLFKFMCGGRKIEAIKEFRAITGDGLKESKDAVEYAMSGGKIFQ